MQKLSSHQAFSWLCGHSGEVFSHAQLEAALGRSRSTFRGWLLTWEKERWIECEQLPGNQGTRYTVLDPEGPFRLRGLPAPPNSHPSRSAALKNQTPAPLKKGEPELRESDNSVRSTASEDVGPENTDTDPPPSDLQSSDGTPEEAGPHFDAGTTEKDADPVRDMNVDLRAPGSDVPAICVSDEPASGKITASDDTLPSAAPNSLTASPTPAIPSKPLPVVPLPLFRSTQWLRLVSAAAIIVSIAMIAYHSAGAAATSIFTWATTLAMAVILSTGKVVLGSQAESFLADGEKRLGRICMAGAVFLLAADASLLYAFRGDSLTNAAAAEKADIESRERVKAQLERLIAEQKHLIAQVSTSPTAAPTGSILATPIRFASGGTGTGECVHLRPPWLRGGPGPTGTVALGDDCATENSNKLTEMALTAETARAKAAQVQADRAAAAARRRDERLAALPALIEAAETEMNETQARSTSDHGASIVARGLNWIPAGVSDAVFGFEWRPVGGRGVEIFWSWMFVLGVEIFAVGGIALAARGDRHARQRLLTHGEPA